MAEEGKRKMAGEGERKMAGERDRPEDEEARFGEDNLHLDRSDDQTWGPVVVIVETHQL